MAITRNIMLALAFAAGVAGGLSGCARESDARGFIARPHPLVTPTDYRLAPPDVVIINSTRVREINGVKELIRPDGRITLPLLGSYFIAGRTCEEAGIELATRAHEYYTEADITVRLARGGSQRVYVFGEVAAPGPYACDGNSTILDVLARARPTRLAETDRIQVLRPGHDGASTHRMTVSLSDMVKNGDASLNALLESGDIVYVPAVPVAAVGLTVRQLLAIDHPSGAPTADTPRSSPATSTAATSSELPADSSISPD